MVFSSSFCDLYFTAGLQDSKGQAAKSRAFLGGTLLKTDKKATVINMGKRLKTTFLNAFLILFISWQNTESGSHVDGSTFDESDGQSGLWSTLLQSLLLNNDFKDELYLLRVKHLGETDTSLMSPTNYTGSGLLEMLRFVHQFDQVCLEMCLCPNMELAASVLVPYVREWLSSLNHVNVSDETIEFIMNELQKGAESSLSFVSVFDIYLTLKQHTLASLVLKSFSRDMTFCWLHSNETLRLDAATEMRLFPRAQIPEEESVFTRRDNRSEHFVYDNKTTFNINVQCEPGAKLILTRETHIGAYGKFKMSDCEVFNEGLLRSSDMSLTQLSIVGSDFSWIRNIMSGGVFCNQNMNTSSVRSSAELSQQNATVICENSSTILTSVRDVSLINVPLLPKDLSDVFRWFQGARELKLFNNDLGNVTCRQLQPSLIAWRILWVSNNGLRSVPPCVLRPDLFILMLSSNTITDMSPFQFPRTVPAPDLRILVLNDNQIRDVGIMADMNVSILLLAGNQISHLDKMAFTRLFELQILDLSRNRLRVLDPGSFKTLTSMFVLSLNDNELETFDLSVTPPLLLNCSIFLMNNRFSHPPFKKNNYTVNGPIRVYAGHNPFACDCDIAGYLQVMADTPTSAQTIFRGRSDMICKYPSAHFGTLLDDFQLDVDRCPVVLDCPPTCTCELSRTAHVISVDCVLQDGVSQLPERMPTTHNLSLNLRHSGRFQGSELALTDAEYLERVVSLNVSGTRVSAISELMCEGLSRAHLLDFSNNNISRLPRCFLSRAKEQATLIMYMAGNPWECTCDTAWLQAWMSSTMTKDDAARDQWSSVWVKDAADVMCSAATQPNTRVLDWDATSCEPHNYLPWVIVLSVVIGLIVIVVPLVYFNRLKVMVSLHATYHIRPFTRTRCFDESKFRYEALVVHGEDELCSTWVVEVLLSKMEASRYRVCIPSRDFLPGDLMAENYMKAVDESKAVVCLVSCKTVQEEWWRYAFQIARDNNARDPNELLLLALLEVVPDADYPEEVLSFLKSNTYLTLEDKWFWKKLFYYLPDPPRHETATAT